MLCSSDFGHLVLPQFDFPWELFIPIAVYIPPQVSTDITLANQINKHCSIVQTSFKQIMTNLSQHIVCPTGVKKHWIPATLYLRHIYKAIFLHTCVKTDHAAFFLTPKYKQALSQSMCEQQECSWPRWHPWTLAQIWL